MSPYATLTRCPYAQIDSKLVIFIAAFSIKQSHIHFVTVLLLLLWELPPSECVHRISGQWEDAADGESQSRRQGRQGPELEGGEAEGTVEDHLDNKSLWLNTLGAHSYCFHYLWAWR